jgi:hypothetical protein
MDAEIASLQEQQKRLGNFTPDPEFEKNCAIEQMAAQARPAAMPNRGSTPQPERIGLCAGYFRAKLEISTLPARIAGLQGERSSLAERLDRYRQTSSNKVPVPTPDPEIDFLWVPAAILSGAAIKLGKTTVALAALDAARERKSP